MDCSVLIDHWGITWFFIGLWHGLIAIVTLLVSLFADVRVYEVCQRSWFYDMGFLGGVILGAVVGLNSPWVFIIGLAIAMVIYFIVLIFMPVIWGIGIALGCLAIYLGYHGIRQYFPHRD